MRRRILLSGLALLPISALAHPPRQPDATESAAFVEEIKRFRDKLAKAIKAKDRATLTALYADRFLHTDATGKTEDRAARLAAAMDGRPMIEALPATELAFRVFTGPTVIATGTSTLGPGEVRWTAVYVTGRDGWLLAGSQETRVSATTN
jgi:hypothetical protein